MQVLVCVFFFILGDVEQQYFGGLVVCECYCVYVVDLCVVVGGQCVVVDFDFVVCYVYIDVVFGWYVECCCFVVVDQFCEDVGVGLY